MRLPITIAAILVASLSWNAPVFSASPVQVVQKSPTNNSSFRQLKINQRLWNRQKITNYRYTLTNQCFCVPEVRGPLNIEVRNGVTTSITLAQTGQPVNPELVSSYTTIPKLFNLISNTINSGESQLSVTYNRKLGYPTQINIGNLAADAGVYTTISNFKELRKGS
ncbi:DUF6174 domain-containing protein [Dendronalium sp. ChiSLP03b]|uniref:DUF6174 domain-containing protein n=1 Tax=Dendronalium sp. ChiSLP03b TaxID=3075381 RepID=UPI002AD58030|nr:DUF6174 domain-containing protein [Dendronalium sp. ChiSLP03b]MDZ8208767.1 DUF6174 domain-containing protein [Dendronalium sp. ChiSLP03b]